MVLEQYPSLLNFSETFIVSKFGSCHQIPPCLGSSFIFNSHLPVKPVLNLVSVHDYCCPVPLIYAIISFVFRCDQVIKSRYGTVTVFSGFCIGMIAVVENLVFATD